jgi:hypothetical protein
VQLAHSMTEGCGTAGGLTVHVVGMAWFTAALCSCSRLVIKGYGMLVLTSGVMSGLISFVCCLQPAKQASICYIPCHFD